MKSKTASSLETATSGATAPPNNEPKKSTAKVEVPITKEPRVQTKKAKLAPIVKLDPIPHSEPVPSPAEPVFDVVPGPSEIIIVGDASISHSNSDAKIPEMPSPSAAAVEDEVQKQPPTKPAVFLKKVLFSLCLHSPNRV